MLNHLPVVGLLFVVVALAVGRWWRSDAILRLGLGMLVAVSLAAIPVFLSGEPSEESIKDLAGVSTRAIEAHEDAARVALIGLELLGLATLVALVRSRGRAVPRRFAGILLVAAVALSGLLAWTAHLGGGIRHPELGAGVAASSAGETEHKVEHD